MGAAAPDRLVAATEVEVLARIKTGPAKLIAKSAARLVTVQYWMRYEGLFPARNFPDIVATLKLARSRVNKWVLIRSVAIDRTVAISVAGDIAA